MGNMILFSDNLTYSIAKKYWKSVDYFNLMHAIVSNPTESSLQLFLNFFSCCSAVLPPGVIPRAAADLPAGPDQRLWGEAIHGEAEDHGGRAGARGGRLPTPEETEAGAERPESRQRGQAAEPTVSGTRGAWRACSHLSLWSAAHKQQQQHPR